MGLTWYLLGALAAGAVFGLWAYSRKSPLNWIAWSGMTLGILLVLFSIAWAAGAVLEGVPRAASMGLLIFGLSGIVILTVTARYIGDRHSGGRP